MIAHDDVALAADPVQVVRSCSWHGIGKEWMACELNINCHCDVAFFSGRFQGVPDNPRYFRVKALELETLFLQRYFFDILVDGHGSFGPGIGNRSDRIITDSSAS